MTPGGAEDEATREEVEVQVEVVEEEEDLLPR